MTIFRHTWLKAVTAVSIVLLAAVIVVLICLPQTLVVRDADSGKIYMTSRCPDGTEFLVEFTHSVNSSVEYIIVTKEDLIRFAEDVTTFETYTTFA